MKKSLAGAFFVVLGALVSGGSSAFAACVGTTVALSSSVIEAFKAQPTSLLSRHIAGGLPLSSEIKALVTSDPETVPSLIGLIANATLPQRAAIAVGLAQAAQTCLAADQRDAANRIQTAVIGSGNGTIIATFESAVRAISSAAGTGGGGFGGGVGGPVLFGNSRRSFASSGSGGSDGTPTDTTPFNPRNISGSFPTLNISNPSVSPTTN